jgi:lysophospholipase L1-like esterase
MVTTMNHALTGLSSKWSPLTRRALMRGALAAILVAGFLPGCTHTSKKPLNTYASWSAAQQDYNEPFPAAQPPLAFNNQTLRQVLRVAMGGEQVRVRFSNLFGKSPITISGAHIARSAGGSSIEPASDTELKFNGQASVTIPAGGELWSDAAALKVPALGLLAVSLFLAAETPVATVHAWGLQTNYVAAGNALSQETLSGAETRNSYYFLSGVDVLTAAKAHVVVAIGDSLTDGAGTTPDTDGRWTNSLARRLQADTGAGAVSVVNAGIAGGRIASHGVGPKGADRFERDVLGQSGVTHVIILLGINDIAFPALAPNQEVTIDQMTAGMQSMIDKAKARGVKVLVGTLLPFKGATVFGQPYYSEEFERRRQAFNAWIRSNPAIDHVIDFEQAVRDPANPLALLPDYDSGDQLHLNNKGAEAMAKAVELSLLKVQP